MKITLYPLLLIALIACKGKSSRPMSDQDMAQAQKELIEQNKRQHGEEMKAIHDFIAKNNWPMQETSTGLNYWIYESGSGLQAKKDNRVSISYTISLLDGTVCYTADDQHAKVIHINHDNVESGMHEALQLMHQGDKAKFIFPSHLAFGFTGDSGKIPQNASVVYDIHLLTILPE